MPTNIDRSGWALAAVEAHSECAGTSDEDTETQISDLVCNLAHLADGAGVGILAAIKRGLYHHAAERGGDEGILNAEEHPDYANSPHARMWVKE